MKRKTINKRDIILDLTSLLDVIFIILMVVMCNQQVAKPETAVNPDPVIPPTIEDRVSTITIRIPYEDDPTSRIMELFVNNSTTPSVIKIDSKNAKASDETNPYSKFKMEIVKIVGESRDMDIPVILTLDDSKMLYRDAKEVTKILSEIDDEYDNLYCRGLIDDTL